MIAATSFMHSASATYTGITGGITVLAALAAHTALTALTAQVALAAQATQTAQKLFHNRSPFGSTIASKTHLQLL